MKLWNKIPVHYRTQLARLARIFAIAFVAALRLSSEANWKKAIFAAFIAGGEAVYRQLRPATPDAVH